MTAEPFTPDSAKALSAVNAAKSLPGASTSWLDERMAWLADRLNPILVKETRQALRGRQFLFTFALVLVAAWAWTIFGAALVGPGLRYGAQGWTIFVGYFLILAAPLLLVVPFTAFRSLAAERDDRTMELVTITQLRARGIVGGKLASAIAQMLIYVSAITPCIASTWLLRGVDFTLMLLLVLGIFLLSVGLSLVALLLATLPRTRQEQTVLTVVLVGGLTCFGLVFLTIIGQLTITAPPPFTPEMWPPWLAVLALYSSYTGLLFLSASSRLMPVSENRSTHLRCGLIVSQAVVLGVAAGMEVHYGLDSAVARDEWFLWGTLLGGQWYLAGILLTSESPDLPRRVQRGLPRTWVGRALTMLLQPGPATGLWFVVANLLTGWGVFELLHPSIGLGLGTINTNTVRVSHFLSCGAAYLIIFLGAGKLLADVFRRRGVVNPVAAPLAHLLLLLLACVIPLTVYLAASDLRGTGWSLLQLTNPAWTLLHLIDRPSAQESWEILLFLSVAAAVTLAANLPSTLREITRPALALPPRLSDELAQQAAAAQAVRPSTPSSPWSSDASPSAPE